ncbi:MAG: hypothetical protein R6W83_10640 [Cryobacterium sp.]
MAHTTTQLRWEALKHDFVLRRGYALPQHDAPHVTTPDQAVAQEEAAQEEAAQEESAPERP